MYNYGEACPISKATSVLCERWTLQIVREMLFGATRFSEFQKMLPRISPSLLNARLRLLCESGIVLRKRIPGHRGYEYHLTAAGKALEPIISELDKWGMRWVYDGLEENQLDAAVLLQYMASVLDVAQLPSGKTVVEFSFTDLEEFSHGYIIVHGDKPEVCDENPGFDVDVYVRGTLRTLSEVWWGDVDLKRAHREGLVEISGMATFTRTIKNWYPVSIFAEDNSRRAGDGGRLPALEHARQRSNRFGVGRRERLK